MDPKDRETNSVVMRAVALLESVARSERPLALAELTAQLQLPKPSVSRLADLLVERGLLRRDLERSRYMIGPRLSALALEAMIHSPQWGQRRAVLRGVVDRVGETCNLTTLDGHELVYLDRVESAWPLQTRLGQGSRVPLHCTASGKLYLALMPEDKRRALLTALPLTGCTPKTITDVQALEAHLAHIRETGIGTDDEEFISGLVAVAVPVLDTKGRLGGTIAVHGPLGRLTLARALSHVPALREAAQALTALL